MNILAQQFDQLLINLANANTVQVAKLSASSIKLYEKLLAAGHPTRKSTTSDKKGMSFSVNGYSFCICVSSVNIFVSR
jgi:hypothetical protein